MYARLGANVVVNDVSEKAANAVVDEITKGKLRFLSMRFTQSNPVCYSWRKGCRCHLLR
jgi:hypothetical protein